MTVQQAAKQRNVGSHVAEVLEAQGIRRGWLARQMGIDDPRLSRLISGQHRWSPVLMARASAALRLPEHVLFFVADEQSCNDSAHDSSDNEGDAA